MKRKAIQERKEEYKLERNEYIRVRRDEEKRYEKKIKLTNVRKNQSVL